MIEAEVSALILLIQKEQQPPIDLQFHQWEAEIAATILLPQRENLSKNEANPEELRPRNRDEGSWSS